MIWGGAKTVPVPYNATEEELDDILPQLNGFFFTGGGLDLVNNQTGEEHQYYKASKRVIEYSMKKMDEQGEQWPILGLCQGFQLFAFYATHENTKLLKKFTYYE